MQKLDCSLSKRNLKLAKVYGDGKCLLVAILEGLKHCASISLSMPALIHHLVAEFDSKFGTYQPFLDISGEVALVQLHKYVVHGDYNQSIVDLVPRIASSAFGVRF